MYIVGTQPVRSWLSSGARGSREPPGASHPPHEGAARKVPPTGRNSRYHGRHTARPVVGQADVAPGSRASVVARRGDVVVFPGRGYGKRSGPIPVVDCPGGTPGRGRARRHHPGHEAEQARWPGYTGRLGTGKADSGLPSGLPPRVVILEMPTWRSPLSVCPGPDRGAVWTTPPFSRPRGWRAGLSSGPGCLQGRGAFRAGVPSGPGCLQGRLAFRAGRYTG
jgi:hypothetical protein